MARRASLLAVVVLVLAGLAVAGWRFLPPRVTAKAEPEGPPAATVTVERGDLSDVRTVSGDLGYGSSATIKGAGTGTVTWLPSPGAVVKRGQPLYRRDDRPVPLFYGTTPLFRPLDRADLTGRDVRVIVDNLRALGYRTGDQPYAGDGAGVLTASLIDAVKRWQRTAGLTPTGKLAPGDVAIQRGKVRVAALAAAVGAEVSADLMSVTGTAKVVTVQLDAANTGSVKRGDRVTVTLPDGARAPAKVTRVGTVAQTPDDGDGPPRTAVTVTLDDAKKAERLDAAPVQVDLAGQTRADVLIVPVGALLAVLEGGYAVQRPDGGLVPVETGLFADGRVEVSGDGLDEGMTVVTTS
ncbi:efflux RND transporter periplasmic adaptor subunit [Actinoplanes sp. NBRC 103695]|uniref:efflux RND transporter periplasmic adaptor subunit n=1 Tax=Actinoplanes sp. NBRC 103695 TaxID=3032202 RepID=UPI0024A2F85E|nr:efflux RND transporter periplasmic adaptor subunit [Actinoplanes sp. NBRC 103695]GLY99780.1 peptidoglycan-binding protein [Actinoplanes sp. NBRC 103695]